MRIIIQTCITLISLLTISFAYAEIKKRSVVGDWACQANFSSMAVSSKSQYFDDGSFKTTGWVKDPKTQKNSYIMDFSGSWSVKGDQLIEINTKHRLEIPGSTEDLTELAKKLMPLNLAASQNIISLTDQRMQLVQEGSADIIICDKASPFTEFDIIFHSKILGECESYTSTIGNKKTHIQQCPEKINVKNISYQNKYNAYSFTQGGSAISFSGNNESFSSDADGNRVYKLTVSKLTLVQEGDLKAAEPLSVKGECNVVIGKMIDCHAQMDDDQKVEVVYKIEEPAFPIFKLGQEPDNLNVITYATSKRSTSETNKSKKLPIQWVTASFNNLINQCYQQQEKSNHIPALLYCVSLDQALSMQLNLLEKQESPHLAFFSLSNQMERFKLYASTKDNEMISGNPNAVFNMMLDKTKQSLGY